MLRLKCVSSALQVVGKGVLGSVGIVMSINEQEGIATVKFPSCEYRKACKASDILTVPISRLCTPRSEVRAPASNTTADFLMERSSLNFTCLFFALNSSGTPPVQAVNHWKGCTSSAVHASATRGQSLHSHISTSYRRWLQPGNGCSSLAGWNQNQVRKHWCEAQWHYNSYHVI